MRSISEVWAGGVLISRTESDDADEYQIALRAAYQDAIRDLDIIITAENPTGTQIVWALKRMAEIEKAELQYHRRTLEE